MIKEVLLVFFTILVLCQAIPVDESFPKNQQAAVIAAADSIGSLQNHDLEPEASAYGGYRKYKYYGYGPGYYGRWGGYPYWGGYGGYWG